MTKPVPRALTMKLPMRKALKPPDANAERGFDAPQSDGDGDRPRRRRAGAVVAAGAANGEEGLAASVADEVEGPIESAEAEVPVHRSWIVRRSRRQPRQASRELARAPLHREWVVEHAAAPEQSSPDEPAPDKSAPDKFPGRSTRPRRKSSSALDRAREGEFCDGQWVARGRRAGAMSDRLSPRLQPADRWPMPSAKRCGPPPRRMVVTPLRRQLNAPGDLIDQRQPRYDRGCFRIVPGASTALAPIRHSRRPDQRADLVGPVRIGRRRRSRHFLVRALIRIVRDDRASFDIDRRPITDSPTKVECAGLAATRRSAMISTSTEGPRMTCGRGQTPPAQIGIGRDETISHR